MFQDFIFDGFCEVSSVKGEEVVFIYTIKIISYVHKRVFENKDTKW
jgi:hypothetical protein